MSDFIPLAPLPRVEGRPAPTAIEFAPDDAVMYRKRAWNRREWLEIPARVVRLTPKMVEIELLHYVRGLYRTMVDRTSLRPASPRDDRLIGDKRVAPNGITLRARASGCFLIHRMMDEIRAQQGAQREREYQELLASYSREDRRAIAILLKHMYERATKAMQDRTGSVADYQAARTAWRKFRGWY